MVLDSASAMYSLPDFPKATPSGSVNPSDANRCRSVATGVSTRGIRRWLRPASVQLTRRPPRTGSERNSFPAMGGLLRQLGQHLALEARFLGLVADLFRDGLDGACHIAGLDEVAGPEQVLPADYGRYRPEI